MSGVIIPDDLPPLPGNVELDPSFDWKDGNDEASAFWPEKRHATCMNCGARMYKVRLTNERGTYDEFRHDGTGSVWCNPPVPITRTS